MSDLERPESDAGDELVTDATRGVEDEEGGIAAAADREPTPDEERMAEEVAADVDPEVGEHYREMTEIGAEVEGEGRIGG